jgi:hypothetical protein
MASALQFGGEHKEAFMLNMIRNLVRFRLAQKVSRGAAKKLGLRPIAGLVGLIGGIRAARRH